MSEQTAEPVSQETETNSQGLPTDPVELQKKIGELLNENASRRVKNKELNDELAKLREIANKVKVDEENRLKEQGEYKELLTQREQELESLKPFKERVERYEQIFMAELETELKGLPEKLKTLVTDSGKNIADQLDMARAIKAEMGVKTNSPGSERPGGTSPGENADEIISKINAEKDIGKRMSLMKELKEKRPDLYEKL